MAATESPIGNGAKTSMEEEENNTSNHNASNSLKLDINTNTESPAVPSHSVPITPDADADYSSASQTNTNIAQDTLTLTSSSEDNSELLANVNVNVNANAKLALATFIVFQSNTGHQLQNFMAYYSQVIPLQNIVIIDHQTDILNADEYTTSLLHKFNDLGAHIWHCEGSFAHKAEMWSWVTNRYTHSSEWVFPLDIDEYIAIAVNKPMKKGSSQDIGKEVLSWNKADFENALLKLKDTGKPFKMEKGDVYPVDCKFDQDFQTVQNANVPSSSKGVSTVLYDKSPMQKIKYVGRRKEQRIRCMDKVFFRGKDFNFTDTGNHFGQTHTGIFTKGEK
mmetsp:Transcript_4242/g.6452  ORF Transcript_4242/g.6452 Transcript_4242/m.6452 type:complete len:335 (+) Transcript_4242:223-1227(+)